MDIYAINNWDATIYAYGINLINLLFSSPVWKALVVTFTVFAIMKTIPTDAVKKSSNPLGRAVLSVFALFLFSFLTLWPVSMTINIYTITKADTYTNVFEWIVPSGGDKELKGTLYLTHDADLPPVVALTGAVLGHLQFWTMWIIDKAGQTLGANSVSSNSLMAAAKLQTLQKQVKDGLDGVVSDIQEAGEWTQEDQKNYALLQQDLVDFFQRKCIDKETIDSAWEAVAEAKPDELSSNFGSSLSMSYFSEHINQQLTPEEQKACRNIANRIVEVTGNICSKWHDINPEANPPAVCSNLVDVSLWQKIKNAGGSLLTTIKELPQKTISFILDTLKGFVIGGAIALAGIINILILGGMIVVIPISLGVVNLFVFFLSPLFFLTQLVQGKFIESTVKILLEMLWARLLYAVFVLAYVIVTILQGPAWKALLRDLGFVAGRVAMTDVVAARVASKLAATALKAGGVGMLAWVFTHIALTLTAGLLVLWFGAQMLRTLIFGEYLHITQVLDAGGKYIKKKIL